MLTLLASLFSKVSLKDWVWAGVVAAILGGGAYLVHHERTVGAAHEVVAVQAVEKAQQAKVDAINAHNQNIEAQANASIQALSSSLASANADLAKRVRNPAGQGGSVIVPYAGCPASQPPVAASAAGGAGAAPKTAPAAPAKRVIDTDALRDDLEIAIGHNEQLQAVIKEFAQAKALGR